MGTRGSLEPEGPLNPNTLPVLGQGAPVGLHFSPLLVQSSEVQAKFSRRQLLQTGLGATLLGPPAYAFGVEPKWLALERAVIPIKGLPPGFEGMKVAVISDVHYPKNISRGFVDRACRLAMSESPDLVVLPGDFVDGHDRSKRVPDMRGLYDRLKAPLGVWGSVGNHDVALGQGPVLREIARNTPVQMLENEHVVLRRGADELCLASVGDLWYGVVDLERALRGVPQSMPRLLLSHNPDLAEDLSPGRTRVDLQISGHTHGGEVLVPGLSFTPSKYGDKFRQGLAAGRSHRVYVTRGIGSPRFARFMARPEVSLLTLVRSPGP